MAQSKSVRLVTEAALDVSNTGIKAGVAADLAPIKKDVADLKVLGGLDPGSVNDTTSANLIETPGTETHTALAAAIVEKGDTRYPIKANGLRNLKTDFGAVGDGVADDTAAIKAFLDAGGGFVPTGTFLHGSVTTSASFIVHVAGRRKSVWKRKNGTNAHGIIIDPISLYPQFYNMGFDGNREGNSSGHLMHLPDAPDPFGYYAAPEFYGCRMVNANDHVLYCGERRQNGRIFDTLIGGTYNVGAHIAGTDWQIGRCQIGSDYQQADASLRITGTACNVFQTFIGPSGAFGIDIRNGNYTTIQGCSIDTGMRVGIRIFPETTPREVQHRIIGNVFFSNSRAGGGLYSHILVVGGVGPTFIGNTFFMQSNSLKTKHIIETTSGAANIAWIGNVWSSAGFATTMTNSVGALDGHGRDFFRYAGSNPEFVNTLKQKASWYVTDSNDSSTFISQFRTGEAFARFMAYTDGRLQWGGGASGPETTLKRRAAKVMELNGAFAVGSYATGARPNAAVAGVGAMIYDSTLKKPLWSDGGAWKDATGKAV